MSVNIVVEMHHSIAFLSPLGMLYTYSGVQMISPSDSSITFRNATIAAGGLFAESSGSKCGSDLRSLKIVRLNSVSVNFAISSISFRFAELELALPLMANMFFFWLIMLSVYL